MTVGNVYVGGMTGIISSGAVSRLKSRISSARALGPGILVCLTVAAAAQMLSEHYHAPQMRFALLLGVGFHFLSEEGPCVPGIQFLFHPPAAHGRGPAGHPPDV